MKARTIKFVILYALLLLTSRLVAQCNSAVNANPVSSGTYYSSPNSTLSTTGKISSGSNGAVVFRSRNGVVLQPGFQATASTNVTLSAQTLPVKMDLSRFEDNDYPDVEPETYSYNFIDPVASSVLTAGAGYVPSMSNRYFISVFGPRYKDNVPNGAMNFDFHQGSDIVDGNIPTVPEDHILCRCDGQVVRVDNVDGGASDAEGRWVTVRCNEVFSGHPEWGNIYMAYRHLNSIAGPSGGSMWQAGNNIAKGQLIGIMGASGTTENIHLHFSLQRKFCDLINSISYDMGTLYNVHPMRAFNPHAYPHVLDILKDAELYLLDYGANSALFRLAVPYNQANIRAITVSLPNGAYHKTYDFEKVSRESTGEEEVRDRIDYEDGLLIYPYPLNRGQSAYTRFSSTTFPGQYPGSTLRGYRVPDEGIFSTPAYVLDLEVQHLPNGYCLEDLQVNVIDIWGNGVKTTGNHAPNLDLYFNPSDPEAQDSRYVADNYLYFKSNEVIEMQASAFDLDGSIAQVSLFVNGNSIMTDNTAPYTFNITASASNFVTNAWNFILARAIDNSNNVVWSDTLFVYVTSKNLLTRRLSENAADAEESKSTGVVATTTSYDLDMCYDVSGGTNINQYIGLWFNDIGIEKNAVVHHAYLQFAAKDAGCGALTINIEGQSADNPPVFSSSDKNISNRISTTAKASWSPGCWKSGISSLDERSADVNSIVQELVNRSGWQTGNNIAFILDSDDNSVRRQAFSVDGCKPINRKVTRLIVEYSAP